MVGGRHIGMLERSTYFQFGLYFLHVKLLNVSLIIVHVKLTLPSACMYMPIK